MLGRIASEFVEGYPADAARILEEAPAATVGAVLASLPEAAAAALLRSLYPQSAAGALAELSPQAAADIAGRLPAPQAAPLLLRLGDEERRKLLGALPATTAAALRFLLRFPPASVGSLLEPQVVTVRRETRVREAGEAVRRAPEHMRKYLYVLDDAQRLVGAVSAHRVLVAEPEMRIGALEAGATPVALRARSSLREASRNPGWERFGILPATDHRGVFLGVVRRRRLEEALADGEPAAPEAGLAGLAFDLADLYWGTAAGFLAGPRKP